MAEIQDVLDKLDDVLDKIADNKELLDEDKSVQRVCHHCGGNGIKATNGPPMSCPDCGGDGVVRLARITKTSEE